MYSIQQEKILAQKHLLTKEPSAFGDDLLALTRDNVARIEAILCIDSNYNKSGDATAAPKFVTFQKGTNRGNPNPNAKIYYGSSAYWLLQLKKHLRLNVNTPNVNFNQNDLIIKFKEEILSVWKQNSTDYSLEVAIYGAVSAIDRENSTHLSSDQSSANLLGNGKIELTIRILDIWEDIKIRLLHRDFSLIYYLAEKTNNGNGRENYSFATKFCHYACYYWFVGMPEQDNYSICDNVLRKAVAKYANAHGVHQYLNHGQDFSEKDFSNYALYSQVIDELRCKYGENISRNGFDHLLWYYHKGHPLS